MEPLLVSWTMVDPGDVDVGKVHPGLVEFTFQWGEHSSHREEAE